MTERDEMDEAPELRTPREFKERAQEAREPITFVPTGALPKIQGDPDYEYRWVRVAKGNSADTINMSARLREGWVPVKAEEMPDVMTFDDPTSRYRGNIEFGGLLLCKMSKERVEARRRYYSERARAQMTGVNNNFLKENDPRMPLFKEHTSKTTNSG